MTELVRTNSNNPLIIELIKELDHDLHARYNNKINENVDIEEINTVVLAKIGEIAVGCGSFRKINKELVEFKSFFVNPYFRTFGVATCIINELNEWTKSLDFKKTVIQTEINQTEAVNFFKKHGFSETQDVEFIHLLDSNICMQKEI